MSYKKCTPDQAKEQLSKGAVFIDIREEYEHDESRIPMAVSIPLDELNGRMDEIPEKEEAIMYCLKGDRSAYVVNILNQQGYDRLSNLEGGFEEWKKQGLPLEL